MFNTKLNKMEGKNYKFLPYRTKESIRRCSTTVCFKNNGQRQSFIIKNFLFRQIVLLGLLFLIKHFSGFSPCNSKADTHFLQNSLEVAFFSSGSGKLLYPSVTLEVTLSSVLDPKLQVYDDKRYCPKHYLVCSFKIMK